MQSVRRGSSHVNLSALNYTCMHARTRVVSIHDTSKQFSPGLCTINLANISDDAEQSSDLGGIMWDFQSWPPPATYLGMLFHHMNGKIRSSPHCDGHPCGEDGLPSEVSVKCLWKPSEPCLIYAGLYVLVLWASHLRPREKHLHVPGSS